MPDPAQLMPADIAAESKFQWFARFGFVARGLLYIVIALLVIATGRTEDLTGAIEYVGKGGGRLLLILIAGGMSGYGVWRIADAVFGMDSGRHHAKAWRHRVAAGFSGIIYLGLAYKSLALVVGSHVTSDGPREGARTALHLPHGQILLIGAGLALVGAGLVQAYKATTCSFLRRLDDRAQAPWAKWLGRIGYAARGVIFVIIGYLLFKAGLSHNAAQAGGLEQALDRLSGALRFFVALGLLLFGIFSLVEARYRAIHRPPTRHIRRKIEERVGG